MKRAATTLAVLSLAFVCPVSAQSTGGAVDSVALARLLSAAQAAHSDGVVIWKDGRQLGAWYFGKKPKRIEAMSATKSVVNLAIGRLVTTGAIRSIDEPISRYYPEWRQGAKRTITIRQLMGHTSGIQNDGSQEVESSPDVVRLALAAELSEAPGTRFYYNNKAVNLLAGIVEKASGRKMDDLLRADVFTPLGITDFRWVRDSVGNPYAYARLEILPEDMAKLGELVLERGSWRGRKIIASDWFDLILRGSGLDPRAGLLWWLIPDRTTFIVDARQIEAARNAGADSGFLRSALLARGRYETLDAYQQALRRAFGDRYWEPLGAERTRTRMNLERREYGTMIGYEASGSFGQYIVVYPDQRLVGVRMITATDSFDPNTDSFEQFSVLLRGLVRR